MKQFLLMKTELLLCIPKIKARVTKTMPDGTVHSGVVESTVGCFIFNEIIPQDLGFVDRSVEGK